MKICIPTGTKDGLKARVYGHFGGAPYFTIYDTETLKCEIIDNGDLNHEHGMCNPVKTVGNAKPDVVIAGGIGAGAISGLRSAGIQVYLGTTSTAGEAVAAFKSGQLKEASIVCSCSRHTKPGYHWTIRSETKGNEPLARLHIDR